MPEAHRKVMLKMMSEPFLSWILWFGRDIATSRTRSLTMLSQTAARSPSSQFNLISPVNILSRQARLESSDGTEVSCSVVASGGV